MSRQSASATHGFVLLSMANVNDSQGLQDVMTPLATNLIVGLGDTRPRAERSVATAIAAYASPEAVFAVPHDDDPLGPIEILPGNVPT
jgi:hypothetical protein